MKTVGEAVATVEQNLLVGRELELDIFRDWLLNGFAAPQLLNISGPPGVGKTTLVQAFAREARSLGWKIAIADGHAVDASEGNLIRALSDGRSTEVESVIRQLNRPRTLLIIDTFEQFEQLSTFLQQELLPRLDANIKVVIAGRRPLVFAWSRADAWPKLVRLLQLDGFSSYESRSYLALRGIDGPDLIDHVIRAAGGNPLAISLAADLISQLGLRDLASDPLWHVAARSLVRRLLSEASDDPGLREAVEACSVVRVFDEATLAAVVGRDDVSEVFDRLCRLSIINPASKGLMLHDHVRAIISDDLHWRRPHHHCLLRQRALDHFKGRLRTSTETERGWLITECFYLWDNPVIREIFFGPETLGQVKVEPATEIEWEKLLERQAQSSCGPPLTPDKQLMSEVMGYPHTRVRVAVNDDGAPVGFSAVLPLSRKTITLLERHPIHGDFVNAYFDLARREALPVQPEDATTYYMLPVVAVGEQRGAVICALFRDLAEMFGLNGTYLCTSRDQSIERLLSECAFEMVTELRDSEMTVRGWALDLTRVGFDGWIQAVVDGRHLQAQPSDSDVQSQILAALTHWEDNAWLSIHCPLLSRDAALADRAEAARRTVRDAFSRARANAAGSTELALRALELAYMKRSSSHKLAMRSLSVSRATFYRLCKRGVRTVAEHV